MKALSPLPVPPICRTDWCLDVCEVAHNLLNRATAALIHLQRHNPAATKLGRERRLFLVRYYPSILEGKVLQ